MVLNRLLFETFDFFLNRLVFKTFDFSIIESSIRAGERVLASTRSGGESQSCPSPPELRETRVFEKSPFGGLEGGYATMPHTQLVLT